MASWAAAFRRPPSPSLDAAGRAFPWFSRFSRRGSTRNPQANQRLSPIAYFTWIQAGELRAEYALYYDRLTLIMTLTVTVVAFLIHLYSRGYMEHEGGYYRFFTYLNLFLFMMLTLVTAASYPLMFVGWEGVGLCSYLLIGFYFTKKSAVRCRQEGLYRYAHWGRRLHRGRGSAVLDFSLAGF